MSQAIVRDYVLWDVSREPISDNDHVELHAGFLSTKNNISSALNNQLLLSMPTPLRHGVIARRLIKIIISLNKLCNFIVLLQLPLPVFL